MTSKTLRKKGVIDCTRGMSREQRAINRRNKRESLISSGNDGREHSSGVPKHPIGVRKRLKGLSCARKALLKSILEEEALAAYRKKEQAEREKRYGGIPGRAATGSSFLEKPFGHQVLSANDTSDLSRFVVSLALFDGDKMLFACSGIPLPDLNPNKVHQTSFLTSSRLAIEFTKNRYKDDKLRVEVCLPQYGTVDGLLGLYDDDIAIVTSLGLLDVHPIDLRHPMDLDLPVRYVCDDDDGILAFGRAFKSGSLLATEGSLRREHPCTWVSDTEGLTEAVLGGPLIGKGARFLGMNHKYHGDAEVTFLTQESLRARLEHFQILTPNELHFRGYSLPKDVKRIEPSGLLNVINWIKSCGYPMPPPLVLELNGQLLNRFEEYFGDVIAWKGYPFGSPPSSSEHGVWKRLPKKVMTNVSRRVVSVASFSGDERFFVCTGLLIKWPGNRAVVLTSASLVRSRQNKDDIDNNLSIKVSLASKVVSGTLEWYDLNYNIAIVSVKKSLPATRPEDIFNKVKESSGKVVAIGRHPRHGLLMASFGEVKYRKKGVKLDCKDLQVSTCKIKKAGIGGPLINLNGRFVGMNFYDGSEVTPFLPQRKIIEVLWRVIHSRLPSQCQRSGEAIPFEGSSGNTVEQNKWPVPDPYWYHGLLEVKRHYIPELPGRHLD